MFSKSGSEEILPKQVMKYKKKTLPSKQLVSNGPINSNNNKTFKTPFNKLVLQQHTALV